MRVETEKITRERLEGWGKRLDQEHSTPFVLVGIGHDEKSGQLCVCITEDTTDEQAAKLLIGAIRVLRGWA